MWRYIDACNRPGGEARKRIGRYFPYRATARWTAQSEAASTNIALAWWASAKPSGMS